jgi:hypothetical protein
MENLELLYLIVNGHEHRIRFLTGCNTKLYKEGVFSLLGSVLVRHLLYATNKAEFIARSWYMGSNIFQMFSNRWVS